jgi:hypothetical protein
MLSQAKRKRTPLPVLVGLVLAVAVVGYLATRWLQGRDASGSSSGRVTAREGPPRPASSLCSHKLSNGNVREDHGGTPLTMDDFRRRWKEMVVDGGITCVDLDVTDIEMDETPGGNRRRRVKALGHPSDLSIAAERGLLDARKAIDIFGAIKVMKGDKRGNAAARAAAARRAGDSAASSSSSAGAAADGAPSPSPPARACVTLELKGQLSSDKTFLEQLKSAMAARGDEPALCYAILGFRPGADIPSGLPVAYAMRDVDGKGPAGTGSCGMNGGEAADAFAQRTKSFGILMPSAACLRDPAARAAILAWKALPPASASASSSSSSLSSSSLTSSRDVKVWTIDDCDTAREMLRLGATHVISNKATQLVESCPDVSV